MLPFLSFFGICRGMALLYVFAIEFVALVGTLRKNAYTWLGMTQPVKLRACALSTTRVQSFSTTYDWHEFVWDCCRRSGHLWPDRLYAVHEPALSFLPSSSSLIPPTNPRSLMFPNHSPLDALAAFAIVFVASALSVFSVVKYIDKVRKDAADANPPA